MKIQKLLTLALVTMTMACGSVVHATLTTLDSGPLTLDITDGSAIPVSSSLNLSGAPAGSTIQSVYVTLNISGGYNGDLVGYLLLQGANGQNATTTLLNRVGTSGSDPFGSGGSGFNVTLSDSGTVNGDIHNATGNPTGTWLPDQFAGANSLNSTFSGLSANGTWRLFLADLSVGGGQSTLNSWGVGVNLSAVPEPATWALIFFVGVAGVIVVTRYVNQRLQSRPTRA